MTQSILLTTKKMLGIAEEYHAFDLDIITHINSVFLSLYQFGIGPETPYQITDETQEWSEFQTEIPGIPTYVYLKVRLLFDPPTNSFLVDSMKEQIKELEWRFDMQQEHGIKEDNITDTKNEHFTSLETSIPYFMRERRSSADVYRNGGQK